MLCEVLQSIENTSNPSDELLSAASHLARCDPGSSVADAVLNRKGSGMGGVDGEEQAVLDQPRPRIDFRNTNAEGRDGGVQALDAKRALEEVEGRDHKRR